MKILFFDIDNTLIPKYSDEITESALEGIKEAKKKGCKIVIASGRGYYAMQKDVKEKLGVDYFITTNGPCINDEKGNPIKYWNISEKDVDIIVDYFMKKDLPFAFKCTTGYAVYNKFDEFTERYCSGSITKDMFVDNTLTRDYHLTHPALSCFYMTNKDSIMDLRAQTPLLKYVGALSGGECFLQSANKGNAVKEVVKLLDGKIEDCLAFGDSDNDVEMLEICGIGICMGNGTTSAKQASDYVTDNIDEDGIYNALKHFEVI